MKDIFGIRLEELREVLGQFKQPAYRARQVAEWLYVRGAASFEEMNNLPKALRNQLSEQLTIGRPGLKARLDSADGRTSKFLLEFADGTAVESVLMRQPYGNSICVSTQAGCSMGCAFCASTLHGLERNLEVGEIAGQAVYINDMLKREEAGKVDTVVIMGSGEPLMNYDNVLAFIRLLHEDYVLGLGYRNFTLSTSGIVPNMYRLAEEGLPISLSLSLHAPSEELRSRLMPINRKYHLQEAVAAASHYAEATGRRVTYEYILIAGLNDGEREAEELANLLRGQLASVNLIPINPVKERELLRPSQARIEAFEKYLRSRRVSVTVRKEMGTDIQAACGQLRNKHLQE